MLLAIAFYPEKQNDNIIRWLLSIAASFPFYFGSNLVLDAMNVVYQKIPDKTVHAIITAALIKCAIMGPRIHGFGVDIEDTNKLLWQYLQEEEIFAAIDEVFQQPGLNDYAESCASSDFQDYEDEFALLYLLYCFILKGNLCIEPNNE